MTDMQVMRLLSQDKRMPKPQNCPDKIYEIMELCWKKIPEERPTFHVLMVGFQELYSRELRKKLAGDQDETLSLLIGMLEGLNHGNKEL